MPSRIVKGHSRFVVLQYGKLGLFPTKDGWIQISKKERNGRLFFVAMITPEEALALQAALNDMFLELEAIEQQKAAEQPND